MSQFARLFLLLLTPVLAICQSNEGIPSFSTIEDHGTDSINLSDLNVMLSVPLRSRAGAIPFSTFLFGNSNCYAVNNLPFNKYWSCGTTLGLGGASFIGSSVYYTAMGFAQMCPDGVTTTFTSSGFIVSTPTGVHQLLGNLDSMGCLYTSFTSTTVDDSGITVSATRSGGSNGGYPNGTPPPSVTFSYTITTAAGLSSNTASGGSSTYYGSGVTSVRDPNGNTMSWTNGSYSDTLGTTALTQPASYTYQWTGPASTTPQESYAYTSLPYRTNNACGVLDVTQGTKLMLTNISFPDGTSLGISPEVVGSGYSGRIATLTLRAGGQINYTYSFANCLSGLTRTTADGTTSYAISSSTNGSTTTVVDPGGNKKVYQFTYAANTNPANVVTQIQVWQNTGTVASPVYTLLSTDSICYNGNSTSCPTTNVSFPITEKDVYHTIAGMSTSSRTQTKYDGYGNIIYLAQYDFGASSPTAATTTAYGTWSGSTCGSIGNYVSNKPCQIVTTMGSNIVAQSRFAYDSHGNLLTRYVWNGSAWLSNATANSYNPNGTIATLYDIADISTTYAYNGTGGCNNMLPTSVSVGGLTTFTTWDCNGAVKLTDKDANQHTTSYTYSGCTSGIADPFWRIMSVTDAASNQACKTYPTGSSPDAVNSTFLFNSGNSVQNTTTTSDGYGRTINVQTQQGPGSNNYDTATTSYGWMGGTVFTAGGSQPCTQPLGSPCSTVHTNYRDALGRLKQEATTSSAILTHTYTQNDDLEVLTPAPTGENAKKAQKEYDGLGRLKSVCGIMSSGGYSSCTQSTGGYSGVFTTYGYNSATGNTTATATRGSQVRSQTLDGLGRVTSSTTPEGGTITNTYDYHSGSPCAGTYSFPGHLVLTQFANGNFECFDYDGLGRLADISAGYSGGGTGACKRFRYDNSTGVLRYHPKRNLNL